MEACFGQFSTQWKHVSPRFSTVWKMGGTVVARQNPDGRDRGGVRGKTSGVVRAYGAHGGTMNHLNHLKNWGRDSWRDTKDKRREKDGSGGRLEGRGGTGTTRQNTGGGKKVGKKARREGGFRACRGMGNVAGLGRRSERFAARRVGTGGKDIFEFASFVDVAGCLKREKFHASPSHAKTRALWRASFVYWQGTSHGLRQARIGGALFCRPGRVSDGTERADGEAR